VEGGWLHAFDHVDGVMRAYPVHRIAGAEEVPGDGVAVG